MDPDGATPQANQVSVPVSPVSDLPVAGSGGSPASVPVTALSVVDQGSPQDTSPKVLRLASAEVRRKFSDPEIMEALDAIQFVHTYPICGFLSVSPEKKLEVCARKAGVYTKHEGNGPCFVHDASGCLVVPASPYARNLVNCASIQEIFHEMVESQGEFRGLNQELAMARTILAAQLQRLDGGDKKNSLKNQEIYGSIMACLDSIRKLAESTAKINSLNNQNLTIEGVYAFLWTVTRIMEEELTDPHVRVKVLDRIASEAVFPR